MQTYRKAIVEVWNEMKRQEIDMNKADVHAFVKAVDQLRRESIREPRKRYKPNSLPHK